MSDRAFWTLVATIFAAVMVISGANWIGKDPISGLIEIAIGIAAVVLIRKL